MAKKKISKKVMKYLDSITNKRARVVIDHILKHGFITTEQLEKDYGYNHPPRAARDVREFGIPLETFRVKSSDGRSIAAYRFGDLSKIRKGRITGRKVFSKELKQRLYENCDGRCQICLCRLEERYLQIDHRIPYEVSGETRHEAQPEDVYMLLCASCNRAKSWSCEHCPNWETEKFLDICEKCYWTSPEKYSHIALREIRRMEIVWEEDEVRIYEKLKKIADKRKIEAPDYVKKVLANHIDELNK